MKLIIILCILSVCTNISAQEEVWDILGLETLIAQHKTQYKEFTNIMINEGAIAITNDQYNSQMKKLKEVEEILFDSKIKVDFFISNVKDVITIYTIIDEIIDHQSKILEVASENAELLSIAIKTETELVKKTTKLGKYVIISTTGINLANNKERDSILKFVIDELRIMRGLSYSIHRQMKTAKRAEIMNSIDPENFSYSE